MMKGAMPYSSTSGKAFCDRTVRRLVNQLGSQFFTSHRILDVGVGSGTYSDRYSSGLLPRESFHWTGVEIWKPYVEQFKLNKKYDELVIGDALKYLSCEELIKDDFKMLPGFNLGFVGDIIEHMSLEQALMLMHYALTLCDVVILSVPIVHYPQPAFEGNPYEEHVKDDWSDQEVHRCWPNDIISYGIENEIGVYVMSRSAKRRQVEAVLKPQIGVYGICKNEETFIERFYHSIGDADHISIVDTGSTDRTLQRLQLFQHYRVGEGGKVPKLQVNSITVDPWRFDDARNVALCLLPLDVDVCVSIDIDELLEPGWHEALSAAIQSDLNAFGRPADRYHHRFSSIWNWQNSDRGLEPPSFSDHWHERIHARSGYRWKLPVHEILVKSGPEVTRWLHNVKMIQKPDLSKPRSSYLPLMEIALQEDPSQWKVWSFYVGELLAAARYDEALVALKKAALVPGADLAFLSMQESHVYANKGDADRAVVAQLSAIAASPSREYRVGLARLYQRLNKPREALNAVLMAAEITTRTDGYVNDPSCWGPQFDQLVDQLQRSVSNEPVRD